MIISSFIGNVFKQFAIDERVEKKNVQTVDESVQTLVNLGLTILQAKVYISLTKVGPSTGRTTAKESKVAPQDVYRVLTELQEKGLAEKIIGRPTVYKATSINEGISLLLKNKKEEYIETEKQAKIMTDNYCENNKTSARFEKIDFTITSKFSLLLKMHDKIADMSEKNIDFIFGAKINEKMLLQNHQYIQRAIKRGVKIRAIISKDSNVTITENPKPLLKNSLFEIRYLPEESSPFGMHIFDKKEVTLAVSEKPMPSLWTNSPHIVKLAEVYFENMWNCAQINYASDLIMN